MENATNSALSRTPRERAMDSCVAQASTRRLADSWRERGRLVGRYNRQVAEAWEQAAAELESAMDVTERSDVMSRLLRGVGQQVAQELREELQLLIAGGVAAPRAAEAARASAGRSDPYDPQAR